jgi:hypothetical protein
MNMSSSINLNDVGDMKKAKSQPKSNNLAIIHKKK